jgi:hypothetical protein
MTVFRERQNKKAGSDPGLFLFGASGSPTPSRLAAQALAQRAGSA